MAKAKVTETAAAAGTAAVPAWMAGKLPGAEAVQQAATAFGAKVEKLAALGPATMEAFKDSSKLLAKGVEDVNTVLLGFSKVRMERAAVHAKALLAARTVQDVVELQTSFVREACQAALSEASKLQSMGVMVASEAAKPLQARATSNVETMLKAA